MKQRIDWPAVIEGYDPDKESVKEYCTRIHIASSGFYTMRKQVCEKKELMPVVVAHPATTRVEINNIPVQYENKISDNELKRLIKLCAEL